MDAAAEAFCVLVGACDAEPALAARYKPALRALCDAMGRDAAEGLLRRVHAAYAGEDTLVASERGREALFAVGDLLGRLAQAAGLRSTDTHGPSSSAADHARHAAALERQRRRLVAGRARNAAAFRRLARSRAGGAAARALLDADDDWLGSRSPPFWHGLRLEAEPVEVRRALVHRLRRLMRARGGTCLPPGTRAHLDDVEARLACEPPPRGVRAVFRRWIY